MESLPIPEPPPPSPMRLIDLVRAVHHHLDAHLDAALMPVRLTYSQWEVLVLLDEEPKRYAAEIARRFGVRTQTIHAIVVELERGGLVERLELEVASEAFGSRRTARLASPRPIRTSGRSFRRSSGSTPKHARLVEDLASWSVPPRPRGRPGGSIDEKGPSGVTRYVPGIPPRGRPRWSFLPMRVTSLLSEALPTQMRSITDQERWVLAVGDTVDEVVDVAEGEMDAQVVDRLPSVVLLRTTNRHATELRRRPDAIIRVFDSEQAGKRALALFRP